MDAPPPSRGMDAVSLSLAPHPPRTVALLNQKGGVGKTTTTVNLAAAFAERGRRLLLVDLDPQAHLALHFGLEPDESTPTAYDLLLDPEIAALDCVSTARPGIDVIVAEVDLAAAEVELAAVEGRETILLRKLGPILPRYDLVFFDCPPSLGLLTISALAGAREILIPMQAHFLPLQGVGRLLETVGLVRSAVNPRLEVSGIILCAHEANTTLAREIVADLESFFDAARDQDVAWRECRILDPPIRRNIKLAEAPSFGQTILDYAPWCAGANDYRLLAENLEQRWFGGGRSTETTPAMVHPFRAERSVVEVKSSLRLVDESAVARVEEPFVAQVDSLERALNPRGPVEVARTGELPVANVPAPAGGRAGPE